MKKISTLSQFLCVVFVIASFVHIGIWAYLVFFSQLDHGTIVDTGQTEFNFLFNFTGFESEVRQLKEVGLSPAFWLTTHQLLYQLAIYGMLFLLFKQYKEGHIFSFNSVVQIRRLGLCVLLWPLVQLIYPSALILILKLLGFLEHGEISFSITIESFEAIATGFIILVIGSIMAEAARLKNEQELVI
ncbi:DUF2975 domain-containing protein [Alteromonas sp. 5E99-2]|uniref:DUF2975 domain-containing protein n=1 Tax=Alteromonas sp. 5E99-2 TaxID=2817683 RepID=UPI001A9874D7|nr:DUF2975 domain-containing protein [Alteromonas sp. 5E99-2]MBO1255657.1 DUF2975 domain-containing protein [Alteromonas sp. 5E99-2]